MSEKNTLQWSKSTIETYCIAVGKSIRKFRKLEVVFYLKNKKCDAHSKDEARSQT